MIKKLRIKLIIVSMFSLFVVLFIIMGTIFTLNYRQIITDADSVLFVLAENDGVFPDLSSPKDRFFPDGSPRKGHPMSPELPYESRYFSVVLNEDGNAISVNTGKVAAVDTSDAIDYSKRVWRSGRSQGFISDYRYSVYSTQLGYLPQFCVHGHCSISGGFVVRPPFDDFFVR